MYAVSARTAGLLAAILVLAGSLAGPAVAQPSRIGNRANGLSYQPTQDHVHSAEQNAGIAPSARKQQDTDDELERLNRQLQNKENNDPLVHPNGAGKVDPDR